MERMVSTNSKDTQRRFGAILVSLCFVFSTAQPGLALSGKMNKDLQKLELKFFEHKYKKESDEKRIERIEKLVFGEAKTGSEEERIQALVDTVPELQKVSLNPKEKAKTLSKPSQSAGDTSNEDAAPSDPSVDYPRVDAIEQTVLGKVFKNEPLGKRLDQLELKAFKKSSNNPDLSKRVDVLEKFVRKHYHKSVSQMVDPRNSLNYSAPMGSNNSAYRAPAYAGGDGGSGSYGMTPPPQRSYSRNAPSDRPPSLSAPVTQKLTWLENHVYGHSYPQKPLIDRVRSLEKTVFPSEPPDTSSSIPMQVKVLVNAVELMHRSPGSSGSPPAQENQTTNSNTGSQFPNWPPKSNAAYGGYASQYQATTGYSTNRSTGAYYPQNQRQYSSSTQNYQPSQQQYGANQAASQNQYNPPKKKHGHPLLKSLAKSLLTVGAVAAGSVLGGGYYGGGYGGYGGMGGYNRGGYGYGNSYGSSYGRRGLYF